MCLISKNDFLNWENTRVKAVFDVTESNHSYEKYIDFDEIHTIRKDLYVNDTLQIANVKEETMKNINKIEEKVNKIIKSKNFEKKVKKSNFFSLKLDEKIKKSISYISIAYASKRPDCNKFKFNKSQLYAILHSSKLLLTHESLSKRLLIK